jgi:hypothetical protein
VSPEATSEALLRRFQPCLRYDSLETYFADSAAEWTDNPPNRLRRAGGEVVATPADGLSLKFLAKDKYGNGADVLAGDLIESSRDDYGRQYLELRRAHPEYRNLMYGRALRAKQRLWLQYWFFYFLNDYQLALGIDVHEGDWEMIQLRLKEDDSEPEIAAYAQHNFCELREWPAVPRLAQEKERAGEAPEPGDSDRPLVYVGRGSHASFFGPGYHPTDFYDITDGKRSPKRETRLEIVDQPPAWLEWPGHWGGVRTGYGGPAAPCAHSQWTNPEALLRTARVQRDEPGPDAPRLWARRRRDRLLLEFDFSPMGETPKLLVATVNSEDEPDVAPHAYRYALERVALGSLQTTIELDSHKHYDIALAVVDAHDRSTPAVLFVFAPSAGLRGLVGRLGSALGRLVHLVRMAFGWEYPSH